MRLSKSRPSSLDLVRAVVLVVVGSFRVGYLFSRRNLDELTETLRIDAARRRLESPEPELLAAVCERLLPYLPPTKSGACLKRSLILFYLWSRLGLSPKIHFGLNASTESRFHGHVWLSTNEALDPLFPPTDHRDALVL